MKTLLLTVMVLILAACGKDGSVAVPLPVPTEVAVTPGIAAPVTPVPTITLTVYSLTKKLATVSVGGTSTDYYGTGFCVVYTGITYCWDDGLKVTGGTTGFQYWGLQSPLTVCPNFHGRCVDDIMTEPRAMSANLTAVLDTTSGTPSIHRTTGEVFASGTPDDIECVEKTGMVDCGIFVIDTDQTIL